MPGAGTGTNGELKTGDGAALSWLPFTAAVEEGGAGKGLVDGSSSAVAAEKSKLSSKAESNLNLDTAGLSPEVEILPRASSNALTPETAVNRLAKVR